MNNFPERYKNGNKVKEGFSYSSNNNDDWLEGDLLKNWLKTIEKHRLTRFETRKIIFSADALYLEKISTGLLKAVEFELMWLKNKREFHEMIFGEDKNRIDMLELRWKTLLTNLKE